MLSCQLKKSTCRCAGVNHMTVAGCVSCVLYVECVIIDVCAIPRRILCIFHVHMLCVLFV